MPDVECVPIHAPGRESRIAEAPIRSVVGLAQAIADVIPAWLDRPFAIFGHSLGGLVGFELARTLRARGLAQPHHLFVSATRAPSVPNPHPDVRHLPDRELLDELNRRYGGSVPDAILESRELRELFVPGLRADFTAFETYEYVPLAPLTCPISVFAGERDTSVTTGMLEPWAAETQGPCERRTFDGGHLFLQTAVQHELIEAIRLTLRAYSHGSSGRDRGPHGEPDHLCCSPSRLPAGR
jgi:medium-chain acyl-[acyl-carrier-protein] hydrolase